MARDIGKLVHWFQQAQNVRITISNLSQRLTDQSQQQKHYNKKWNMLKVNNKEARKTSTVSLFLTSSLTLRILLCSLYSAVLHDVKMPKYVLYTRKKKKKVGYQIPIWSVLLPNVSPQFGLLKSMFGRGIFHQPILLKIRRQNHCSKWMTCNARLRGLPDFFPH